MVKKILLFTIPFVLSLSIMILYVHKTVYQNIESPKSAVKIHPTQFSLDNAPTDSLKGTIRSSSGNVLWQSRIASTAGALNSTQEIQQGESIKTEEKGRITIEFQKISTVSAAPNTQLEFIQTLPSNMVIAQRSGTAEYMSESTPLSIRTLHLLAQQNSGNLTVVMNDEDPIISIEVTKGSADVAYNDTDNISTLIHIPNGKTFTFNDETRTGRLR